jgi:hypothetical protein
VPVHGEQALAPELKERISQEAKELGQKNALQRMLNNPITNILIGVSESADAYRETREAAQEAEVLEKKDAGTQAYLADAVARRQREEAIARRAAVEAEVQRLERRLASDQEALSELQAERDKRWFITGDLDEKIAWRNRSIAEAQSSLASARQALQQTGG